MYQADPNLWSSSQGCVARVHPGLGGAASWHHPCPAHSLQLCREGLEGQGTRSPGPRMVQDVFEWS
jgi:hypothetical protein